MWSIKYPTLFLSFFLLKLHFLHHLNLYKFVFWILWFDWLHKRGKRESKEVLGDVGAGIKGERAGFVKLLYWLIIWEQQFLRHFWFLSKFLLTREWKWLPKEPVFPLNYGGSSLDVPTTFMVFLIGGKSGFWGSIPNA